MTVLSPKEIETLANILDTCQELDALGRLLADWNGYGAEPISPAIILAAKKFIEDIPDGMTFPKPRVVPITKGRLQLEWNGDGRSLEIEFASPSHVCYLQVDEHEESEVQSLVSLAESRKLYELIRWFAEGEPKGGAQ